MSKKKNKKLKKHSGHKASVKPFVNPSLESQELSSPISSATVNQTSEDRTQETEFYETDKYGYVKKDISKIIIILASLFILLFVFYYFSVKTSIFSGIGDWIYRILNIQTL